MTKTKRVFFFVWLALVFSAVGCLFWYQEWRYAFPTPIPPDYHAVAKGEKVSLDAIPSNSSRPLFIHFFNPGCPCSRFNIPHFRSLVKQYGQQLEFVVVVMDEGREYTAGEICEKLGVQLPVLFDASVAEACGVYSTPQAALIKADRTLYYRGNYNRSRYCTDRNSNFAQMAIDSLLSSGDATLNVMAYRSYGCELPSCKK